MSITDAREQQLLALACRPSERSSDTKAHRSSIVETNMPAAFAIGGGSLHHPVSGRSSTASARVSGSGM